MAQRSLFQSVRARLFPGRSLPSTDTRNAAGGTAYRMDARSALAQLA